MVTCTIIPGKFEQINCLYKSDYAINAYCKDRLTIDEAATYKLYSSRRGTSIKFCSRECKTRNEPKSIIIISCKAFRGIKNKQEVFENIKNNRTLAFVIVDMDNYELVLYTDHGCKYYKQLPKIELLLDKLKNEN